MRRRNMLRCIGTAAVTTGLGTSVVSAKKTGITMKRRGSFNNPLDAVDVKRAQEQAVRRYEAKYKDQQETSGVIAGVPDYEEPLKFIAYFLHIDPQGRTRYFIGLAPDPDAYEEDKPNRQRMLSNITRAMKQFERETTEQSVSTMGSNWGNFSVDTELSNPVAHNTTYVGDDCPTGQVIEESKTYEHPDYSDVFAIASECDVIPGGAGCSNSWGKERYWFQHAWQSGSYDTGKVTDWAPNTSTSSDITGASFSISKGGIGIGLSWQVPDIVLSNSNNEEQGYWDLDFTDDNHKKDSTTANFATYCDFQSSPGYGQKITETWSKIKFDKWDYYDGRYFDKTTNHYYYP